ncbi:MAG: DNA-binding protein [Chlorobiaceae bacterium]|nr:DNA-binding protein [Chlorobiaceae bacterium]
MKNVMGRGLDALIKPQSRTVNEVISIPSENQRPIAKEIFLKIKLEKILPNPFQPRTNFDQESLEELKKSILANGLIQPITVRKIEVDKYQIISGERRFRAFKEIGYLDIPAYVLEVFSDEAMLAMALIENLQREQLNPIEIAVAYKRLIDDCNLTQDLIAERVGKDRTTIANTIRLLKLPSEIQDALVKEEVSIGHARALINLPSTEKQLLILKKIIEDNLSVRKVEQLVKYFMVTDGLSKGGKQNPKKIVVKSNANLTSMDDKLRKILGTKVSCYQKQNGTGEIVIQFYSNDEFERLLELFQLIENNYN